MIEDLQQEVRRTLDRKRNPGVMSTVFPYHIWESAPEFVKAVIREMKTNFIRELLGEVWHDRTWTIRFTESWRDSLQFDGRVKIVELRAYISDVTPRSFTVDFAKGNSYSYRPAVWSGRECGLLTRIYRRIKTLLGTHGPYGRDLPK